MRMCRKWTVYGNIQKSYMDLNVIKFGVKRNCCIFNNILWIDYVILSGFSKMR